MNVSDPETALELIRSIETCYLLRLPLDCDEDEKKVAAHYRTHGSSLRGRVGALRRRLADADVSHYSPETRVEIVTAVIILLQELRSKGPWSPEGFANFAVLIEEAFTGTSNLSLERFAQDAGEYRQAMFDAYFEQLHRKLTRKEWKKYPAAVEVYCNFLNKIQEYKPHVELNPVNILPAALLLIDDFNSTYKRKGLESCLAVLKCLEKYDFKSSNYQQVIYESLGKVTTEKDVEILKICTDCLVLLLPMFPSLPSESEWNHFDELVKNVLEDIYVETNLERKAVCLGLLTALFEFQQVNSVRYKKTFDLMLCDCLDLSASDCARRILWPHVIKIIKTWLKYCWCIWNLDNDKKIVSLLFKLLFIQCQEKDSEKYMDELEAIIVCIISLCTKDQKDKVLLSLKAGELACNVNEMFTDRLKHIESLVYDENAVAPNTIKTTNKSKERLNRQMER